MSYPIIVGKKGRVFETHAAGLNAVIIDSQERSLTLSSPQRDGYREPVNGGYDGGETILTGLMREIHEEAGEQIVVRPITAVHSYNFRYDETIPHMISLIFLFEYLGGEVIPGDDMTGSEIKWMSLDEIQSGEYEIIVPNCQAWVYERAVKFYRLLKNEAPIELQPDLSNIKNKYGD